MEGPGDGEVPGTRAGCDRVSRGFAGLSICGLLFSAGTTLAQNTKPIKALLILGGCCHDYAQQKDILKKGIEERA